MTKRIELKKDSLSLESHQLCEELENNNILFFPPHFHEFLTENPFVIDDQISQELKSIFFDPDKSKKKTLLEEKTALFSHTISSWIKDFLSPYSDKIKHLGTTFWSEGNRYNDETIASDILPKKQSNGSRILRFYIQFHPKKSCCWTRGSSFEKAVKTFKQQHPIDSDELPLFQRIYCKIKRKILPKMKAFSPYDFFLFRLHNFIKKKTLFQEQVTKQTWEFPSFSSWMLFTDSMCYNVNPKQSLFEQIFIVPQFSLLNPEKAPVCLLERLTKKVMVNSQFIDLM